MSNNIRRDVLPIIRTAFLTRSYHATEFSPTEQRLLYDIVSILEGTPYEYMLYMAMIESLDGLERFDLDYSRSVKCFYEGVFRE